VVPHCQWHPDHCPPSRFVPHILPAPSAITTFTLRPLNAHPFQKGAHLLPALYTRQHSNPLTHTDDGPVPFGDVHDTFLQTIVPRPWILSVGIVWRYLYLHLMMMSVYLLCLHMEPRLAPLWRPTSMEPVENLVCSHRSPSAFPKNTHLSTS
jgi:hypothetical protein